MSFIYYATKARTEERKGWFIAAHESWLNAVLHARKDENRHWAECRADYCLKSSGGRRVQVNSPAI